MVVSDLRSGIQDEPQHSFSSLHETSVVPKASRRMLNSLDLIQDPAALGLLQEGFARKSGTELATLVGSRGHDEGLSGEWQGFPES